MRHWRKSKRRTNTKVIHLWYTQYHWFFYIYVWTSSSSSFSIFWIKFWLSTTISLYGNIKKRISRAHKRKQYTIIIVIFFSSHSLHSVFARVLFCWLRHILCGVGFRKCLKVSKTVIRMNKYTWTVVYGLKHKLYMQIIAGAGCWRV